MSVDSQALLRLQELTFIGAGTYLRSTGPLPLADMGCVLVCGEEGAGKSMIPEVMTLIMHGKGSPRVQSGGGGRPKSLTESSIINPVTGYQGTLAFESGFGTAAQDVEIEQSHMFGRKKVNKYTITIDGVRDRTSGKPAQKRLVKRLAPLSYEEWLGVVYLHQGGIHDLLAGTPKEKKEYLTSVFGLDFYDDLVHVTAEELKDLKKIAEGAGALEQRLTDLQEEVREQEALLAAVPGGIEEVEAGITKLTKRLQTLSKKIGNVEAQQKTAATYQEVMEQLDDVEGPDDEAETGMLLQSLKGISNGLVQQIAADKETLRTQEKWAKAYRKVKRWADETAKDLKKAKKARTAAKEATKGLPRLTVLQKLNEALDEVGKYHNSDAPMRPSMCDSPEWREASRERTQMLRAASKLSKLADQDHSKCPTCDHELDPDDLKETIDRLVTEADILDNKALNGAAHHLFAVTDWWAPADGETAPRWLEIRIRVGKAIEAYEELMEARDEVERATQAAEEAAKEFAETEEPPSTEKLAASISEAEEQLDDREDQIHGLEARMKLYERAHALSEAAEGVDLEALDEELATLKATKAKTRKKFEQASVIKAEYDQAQGALEELNKQVEYVVRKIDEHAENAAKIKHYELTLVPYFNALRAGKVHSCASVLEGVLPVYVGAMAGGQYAGAEVKLELAEDLRKMDLKLRTGAHDPWLSALQTSGGQRRRFTLATIGALREVSPRHANIMFFDEPFADLQAEGKVLFINKLVPTLLDRCEDLESVFVIAHDKEVLESGNDAFDSVWVAERDQRGSHLLLDQKLAQVVGR